METVHGVYRQALSTVAALLVVSAALLVVGEGEAAAASRGVLRVKVVTPKGVPATAVFTRDRARVALAKPAAGRAEVRSSPYRPEGGRAWRSRSWLVTGSTPPR